MSDATSDAMTDAVSEVATDVATDPATDPMSGLFALATRLVSAADRADLTIATAESCTGGLIAGAITEVPGSSAVLDRGFVTYSNRAKIDMLDVEAAAIDEHGAVSAEVAIQMALGAIRHSHADLAVSVTGIAGPGGGTATKPVGLVHMALARRGEDEIVLAGEHRLTLGDAGGRSAVRMATVRAALQALLDAASLPPATREALGSTS